MTDLMPYYVVEMSNGGQSWHRVSIINELGGFSFDPTERLSFAEAEKRRLQFLQQYPTVTFRLHLLGVPKPAYKAPTNKAATFDIISSVLFIVSSILCGFSYYKTLQIKDEVIATLREQVTISGQIIQEKDKGIKLHKDHTHFQDSLINVQRGLIKKYEKMSDQQIHSLNRLTIELNQLIQKRMDTVAP